MQYRLAIHGKIGSFDHIATVIIDLGILRMAVLMQYRLAIHAKIGSFDHIATNIIDLGKFRSTILIQHRLAIHAKIGCFRYIATVIIDLGILRMAILMQYRLAICTKIGKVRYIPVFIIGDCKFCKTMITQSQIIVFITKGNRFYPACPRIHFIVNHCNAIFEDEWFSGVIKVGFPDC